MQSIPILGFFSDNYLDFA